MAGPFLHSGHTVRSLNQRVLAALLPILAAAIWMRAGAGAGLAAATVLGTLLADGACKRTTQLQEGAVVTGVLLALMLPLATPWWIGAIGGAVAAVAGKHAFGGRRRNPFNPAAVAWVLLAAAVPPDVVDGMTAATPLATVRGAAPVPWPELLWGGRSTTLAGSVPVVVVLAGGVLATMRTIDWRVPAAFLATVAGLALVLPPGGRLAGHAAWLAGDPLTHLVAGGTLLTAGFLLTDPVTSPLLPGGRIAFAVIAGAWTMTVRYYTPYADGAAMGVLLANACVPLLDGEGTWPWRRGT